jgi:hypothetical protein
MLLAVLLALGSPTRVEHVVRIDIPNHNAVYALQRQTDLAIIDAQASWVTAYADDAKVRELRELGYQVTILVQDYRTLTAPFGTYATYAEVCSTMASLAQQYPAITKLETLGFSALGRAIPIMKVTNNPTQEADKPRIRLNGVHHGNEKIATEITLSLLEYLCQTYDTNAFVHSLVDTREIWIDPIFNVDGHIANSRYNGNGVDINRDYGYMWGGMSDSSPAPLSQPETRAMREHAERHVINLEFSYHSSASYVNYLWDNHPADPDDSDWIIALSDRYADSTYGPSSQLQPINGFDWYECDGSCQDQTFGIYGGLGWTIETPLPSARPGVDSICVANRRALLDVIRLAGWGITGLVHDSLTGAPLFARVEFLNPSRWQTYTQPQVGDFHKMLAPGTYSVRATANGYVPLTISDVSVPESGAVSLDFPLVRESAGSPFYVQKAVIVRRYDRTYSYSDWVTSAFGPPDSVYYSVGSSDVRPSYVVFDVDPNQPVRNHVGDDITVYATGKYSLYAGNDWAGPWSALGTALGTASFDLDSAGLDSARYLKVASDSLARIDAIAYFGQPATLVETPNLARLLTRFRTSPNPVSRQTTIDLGFAGPVVADVSVLDITGRTVRTLARGSMGNSPSRLVWNLRDDQGRVVPEGIYFCSVSSNCGFLSRKIVVER